MSYVEVVFSDLDGTLVNSEIERINTYYFALDACGIENYNRPKIKELIGNSERDNLSMISPRLTEEDFKKVIQVRKKYLSKIQLENIKVNKKVLNAISKYRQIIIVTNSSYEYAERICFNLLKISCEIVSLQDNLPAKPDPFLYLRAFKKFSNGNKKIVYEDSIAGLKSAKAAGADIIYKVSNNKNINLFFKSSK